jgi:hypothetical protein
VQEEVEAIVGEGAADAGEVVDLAAEAAEAVVEDEVVLCLFVLRLLFGRPRFHSLPRIHLVKTRSSRLSVKIHPSTVFFLVDQIMAPQEEK